MNFRLLDAFFFNRFLLQSILFPTISFLWIHDYVVHFLPQLILSPAIDSFSCYRFFLLQSVLPWYRLCEFSIDWCIFSANDSFSCNRSFFLALFSLLSFWPPPPISKCHKWLSLRISATTWLFALTTTIVSKIECYLIHTDQTQNAPFMLNSFTLLKWIRFREPIDPKDQGCGLGLVRLGNFLLDSDSYSLLDSRKNFQC